MTLEGGAYLKHERNHYNIVFGLTLALRFPNLITLITNYYQTL